jgi:hypothetical protein
MKIIILIIALALIVSLLFKINATNKCLKNPVITGWVFNDKGCCV